MSERTKIDARGTYCPGPLMELIAALKLINVDDEIDLVPRQKAGLSGRAVTQRYFSADRERMVMPAFGAFTGGLNVRDAAFADLFGTLAFTTHNVGRGKGRLYAFAAKRCLSD